MGAAVGAHGWKSLRPFAWDGTHLCWPQPTGQGVVGVTVSEVDGYLQVTSATNVTGEAIEDIRRAVRRCFFLDCDFGAFHEECRRYRDTVAIAEAGLGPLLRSSTPFEDAVKTLLTTNVTWALTKRMAEALCQRFGGSAAAFPTPTALAHAPLTDLQAAGLGYRAAYVQDLARRVVTDDLNLAALEAVVDPRPVLRTIRGFGPYAVAHMAMLLGCFSDIPVDSWALTLAQRYLTGGARATKADLERHFERFGEWRALVYRCYPWGEVEPRDW